MTAARHILALDQGTTSSRSLIFDAKGKIVALAQREFTQHFPNPGWVEHDANEIWTTQRDTIREALNQAHLSPRDVAAVGITNQRETTVVWDRATGEPIAPAIVWQDRRTAARCDELRDAGLEAEIAARTGLLLDPYFSATKIAWLLDNVAGARDAAERGELAFGTVDSFLLWRLTGGRVHATDATNAARTMLFDIRRGAWDDDLLRLFRIPAAMLPEVRDCAAEFGTTAPSLFGGAAIPIRGIAGDQQAATVGQACFAPGMVKSTYGTGCFALLNTGATPVASRARLLTTIAYQLGGARTYALEGASFVAGAAVPGLRDGRGINAEAREAGALAAQADPAQAVYLVPAFVGLGAPHWDAEARGAIFGLTRAAGRAELARAALESVAYQTRDLLAAMEADFTAGDAAAAGATDGRILRVDGGMVASDWTMQFLADLLGAPVDRPTVTETTALGVAWLAGLQAGLCAPPDAAAPTHWRLERRFLPAMAREEAERRYAGWQDAVRRTLTTSGTEGR